MIKTRYEKKFFAKQYLKEAESKILGEIKIKKTIKNFFFFIRIQTKIIS
jgi:hypothetical protein